MNNKTDIGVKYVSPLKKICMTIGELPASYLETMSYYEMLVWFVEFLKNQIIPTVNNNAEAVQELQSLYEELRQYVNNYFDNLDVQDEINNKLEAMAESGQLTDIIAQYLGLAGIIAFDTVADMKLAENLVNGSKCQTLGFRTVNDGGNALYKVRTITNNDVIDESTIIALYDNTLIAELIIDDEINVKQLGAYGDNTHDDTNIIKKAIDLSYNSNLNTSTSWKYGRKIYFPFGIYLITSSLIDSSSNISNASFKFVGDGQFNTTIKTSQELLKVFDNNNYFGYTTFENLNFEGNNNCMWMDFVGGSSTQGLRINKCRFKSFKTIIQTSGGIMTSEVTFFECKITDCGTTENKCDLFIFNNSQGVNWRFIATDIESFTGSCLHYLKGTSIFIDQGSIIPINGSNFVDLTNGDYNTFGEGNRPHLIMNGSRFELRNSSYLLYKPDNNNVGFKAVFNNCGMGGGNLPSTGFQTINLGAGNNNLTFNNCNNMLNYGIKGNIPLSGYSKESDYISFNNCNITPSSLLNNSNITHTGEALSYLPLILIDGVSYLSTAYIQAIENIQFKDVVIQKYGSQLGLLIKNNGTDVEHEYFIDNLVKAVNVCGIAKSGYGDTHTFTVTAYDGETELGSVSGKIIEGNNLKIDINRYISTLKLVTTSSYSTTVYKPLIISVERL